MSLLSRLIGKTRRPDPVAPAPAGQFQREDLTLTSQGETLAADFYRPAGVKRPPVIIMAHGFAAERIFSLPASAERFAAAGYAVVLFDYRNFGGSTGQPRELVSAKMQVEDWQAVLEQVRKRKDINARKIVLWGTSFSGGHVMTVAARNRGSRAGIIGIISLVPNVDGLATSMLYPKTMLPKAMTLALRDLAAARTGREPVRIPVVAESGLSCLTGADTYRGYMGMMNNGRGKWTGMIPARVAMQASLYRPIAEADKIQVPALIISAANDSLIPVSSVRKAAKRIRQSHYIEWPMDHFDLYQGEWFERGMIEQLAFLRKLV